MPAERHGPTAARPPTAHLALLVLVVLASATGACSAWFTSSRASSVIDNGGTSAPDLRSVENFRSLESEDGPPATLVDFVFDDVAHLVGGDRSNFHLVPPDGGEPASGRSVPVGEDPDGDDIVTVRFDGAWSGGDWARGFVDGGVVSTRDAGANASHPLNTNQAVGITDEGRTANPDLVQVTLDGDLVRFEFDQELASGDVDPGSLWLYWPTSGDSTYLRATAAEVVELADPWTLLAFFGTSLPSGSLADAAGAYVRPGGVRAVGGGRGANAGHNAFDEVGVLVDSGAEVCPVSRHAGDPGGRGGPTDAPDLVAVGDFRTGPTTAQFERTTCVDFVFDQPAFLVGGDRTNFHLVPLDGGSAIDASTAVDVPDEVPGDRVVTVVFPGTLVAGDVARGTVDTGVVGSDAAGATAAAPLNVNQSAVLGNDGLTANPDVVAIVKDGDQVVFRFDQDLASDDVIQDTSGLRLYFPGVAGGTRIAEVGSSVVTRVNARTLRATYTTMPGRFGLDDAVGGFVTQGTVQAAAGRGGERDGVSSLAERSPLGDTGAVVCAPAPRAGRTGDGSGPTTAPDLLEVGNLRPGPTSSQGTRTTCVDFVFDQPADLVGGDRTNFHLVAMDAGDALDATTNVVVPHDQSGDVVVTIAFPGVLRPDDLARGFVDSGVVGSDPSGATAAAPLNVNQSAVVGNEGRTRNPDLLAVRREGQELLFVFDEPLTTDDVVQSTSGLRVYFAEARESSRIPDAGAQLVVRESDTTLRASFGDLPGGRDVGHAVGAFVVQGAVQAAPGSRGGNDGSAAFAELVLDPEDRS